MAFGADSLSKELSNNLAQLVEKYLFEECYDEFLFAGLVVAYVREHKEEVHACNWAGCRTNLFDRIFIS